MNKRIFYVFLLLVVPLLIAQLACLTVTGGAPYGDTSPEINGEQGQESVNEWYDEDGHAVVGDENTPRIYDWLADFITAEYPGTVVQNHGSWMQATLPDGLVVSWAEWGEEDLVLGQVEGLYENKPLFVAMRDFSDWVKNPLVVHYECSGTYIPSYNDGMSNFDVHYSTIIQFDGNTSQTFVNKMTSAWSQVRLELDGCP